MTEKTFDTVNNPQHYAGTKIEVIDYIEDKGLGFHLGNVVKYVSRAGRKDKAKTIEDLEKAGWYLKRYIEFLKNESKNESAEVSSTTIYTPTPNDSYIIARTISAPQMPIYNNDKNEEEWISI